MGKCGFGPADIRGGACDAEDDAVLEEGGVDVKIGIG